VSLTGFFLLQLPLDVSPLPPTMPQLLPPPLQSSSLSGTIVSITCVGLICHHLFVVVFLGRFLMIPLSLVWDVSLSSSYNFPILVARLCLLDLLILFTLMYRSLLPHFERGTSLLCELHLYFFLVSYGCISWIHAL
jgi:hypothetical protein